MSIVSLSEQNLLDCADFDGCEGGTIDLGFDIINKLGGIQDTQSYPYNKGQKSVCKFDKTKSVLNKSIVHVTLQDDFDEDIIKSTLTHYGPIAAGMHVNEEFLFHSAPEVYFGTNSSEKLLNHGVLIVGYGTDEKGNDYWIIVSINYLSHFTFFKIKLLDNLKLILFLSHF